MFGNIKSYYWLLIIVLLLVGCSKEQEKKEERVEKIKSDKQVINPLMEHSSLGTSLRSESPRYEPEVEFEDHNSSASQAVVYSKLNSWNKQRDYYEIAFNEDLLENVLSGNLFKYIKLSPKIPGVFEKIDSKIIRFYPDDRFEGDTEYKVELNQSGLFGKEMATVEMSFFNDSPILKMGQVSLYSLDQDNTYYLKFNIHQYRGSYLEEDYKNELMINVGNQKVLVANVEAEANGQMNITSKKFTASGRARILIRPKTKLFNSQSEKELYYSNTIEELLKFNINNIDTITDNQGQARIEITFSKNLDTNQSLAAYLFLDGQEFASSDISKFFNKVILTGDFILGQDYKLDIKAGIRAFDNSVLKKDINKKLTTYNRERQLEFVDKGIFLSRKNNNSTNIKVINYSEFTYELWSVQVDNIAEMIHNLNLFSYSNNSNQGYYRRDNLHWYGQLLKEENIETGVEKDKESFIKLDLGNVIEHDSKKIYILNLIGKTENGEDLNLKRTRRYSWMNHKVSKLLLATDYAITAKAFDNKVAVRVVDVLSGQAISRADVELRAFNNTLLASGKTDRNGWLILDQLNYPLENGDFFIIAEKRDNIGFLSSQSMYLDNSKFKVESNYSNSEYKLHAFLDRNLYRPGEDVNLIAMVRDKNNEIVQEDIPLIVTVYDANNTKVISEKIKDLEIGLATYKFSTKESSMTGQWQIELKYGSLKEYVNFTLETFVPERINTSIKTDKDFYNARDSRANLELASKYLFGEPLVDALCQVNISYNHDYSFANDYFAEYSFYDDYKNFDYSMYSQQITLKTNSNGRINTRVDLLNNKETFSPYFLNIHAQVTEKGGRPIERKLVLPVSPQEKYIGLSNNRYLKAKAGEFSLPFIIVDGKGNKLTEASQIEYVVYAKRGSWWWDYDDFYQSSFKNSESTTIVTKGVVTSGKDNIIKFTPKSSDFHVFIIEAKITGQENYEISRKYYNSYWGDSSELTQDTSLELKLDKDEYQIGDKVKLNIPSSKNSLLYITISKQDKILKQDIVKSSENGNYIYEFTTDKDMVPNIYADVRVIQGQNEIENDLPLRLYGIIPIRVIDKASKLDITLDIPERISSNSRLEGSIDVGVRKKTKYIVSVVDQGLINKTNYKIPNPWSLFYQSEAYYGRDFDNFSYFINAQQLDIFRSILIGGGLYESEASFLAMGKDGLASLREMNRLQETGVQRFNPVTYFLGILETDNNGKGDFHIDIEDYTGSLKVCVIAVNEQAFGQATKYTIVKDKIITMPTLPRVLTPQDEIEIPVNVIIDDDIKSPVAISLSTNELVQVSSQTSFTIPQGEKSALLIFKAKVLDNTGKATFKFTSNSKKFSGEKNIEIGVRLPAPYETDSQVLEFKDNLINLTIPNKGFANSNQVYLTFTQGLVFDADQLVQQSLRYPYGGAVMKTALTFNQLLLSNFVKDINLRNRLDQGINTYFQNIVKYNRQGLYEWQGSWKESSERKLLNIYALHTAIIAKEKGYNINEFVYSEILNYLSQSKTDRKEIDFEDAYQLYVLALAGQADIAKLNYYIEKRGIKVNSNAINMLYMAYGESGFDIKTIEKDLKPVIVINDQMSSRILNPIEEVQSALELYLNSIYKNSNGEDKAKNMAKANAIANKLSQSNYWNYYDMSWNLFGLSAYISNLPKDFNDYQTQELQVSSASETNKIKVNDFSSLDLTPYKGQKLEIKGLSNKSENVMVTLYNTYVPKIEDTKTYSNDIELFITYQDLDGNKLDISSLKQGQIFIVNFEVIPKESKNDFALTYILPSGWEFASQDESKMVVKPNMAKPEYVDLRDDRAILYGKANYFSRIGHQLIINAVSKGKYIIPAASVEDLYNPEIRASIKGKIIEVK